jgi:hypothetical protein
MTYPPSPVNQFTFVVITSAGVLTLLAAAVLALLQPTEAHSIAAVGTADVSTTGSVVPTGVTVWRDPIRPNLTAEGDVLLATASD